jgi:hypothetical protein
MTLDKLNSQKNSLEKEGRNVGDQKGIIALCAMGQMSSCHSITSNRCSSLPGVWSNEGKAQVVISDFPMTILLLGWYPGGTGWPCCRTVVAQRTDTEWGEVGLQIPPALFRILCVSRDSD